MPADFLDDLPYLSRTVSRLEREATRYGIVGWGADSTYHLGAVTPEAVVDGVTMGFCPGGALDSQDDYDYDHHAWDVKVECPATGEDVAHVHCIVEIVALPGGAVAGRILSWVHDLPRGTGFCFIPVSHWALLPAADAVVEDWQTWFSRAEELVAGAYESLVESGLSYAAVWIQPRRIPPVDGTECPCDECQRAAAHLLLAGGLDGVAAVENRVRSLNRKIRRAGHTGLHIDWHADVSACDDCDKAHLAAIASCEDDNGAVLWAMGGESAHEALDGIETWAWSLLVTDLAAREGLGRGDA
jgi:hypothetical protein